MLLGSGCLASRACGSECKTLHTEWLSHQERPRSNASSLAHAQSACRLLVKTLSHCSQISSEMETELVLLKLDACWRLLGNISSHSSFCESSISFFGLQGSQSKSFEHFICSEILLHQEMKFLQIFKSFSCLRMRVWVGIWAKKISEMHSSSGGRLFPVGGLWLFFTSHGCYRSSSQGTFLRWV